MNANERAEKSKVPFGAITFLSVCNLLIAVLKIWRTHTWEDRSNAAMIIMGIVGVWILSLQLRRTFGQLAGQVGNEVLARLSDKAYSAIVLGYVLLILATPLTR
jgi:hypothetical protein